jgi:hypothetical protein
MNDCEATRINQSKKLTFVLYRFDIETIQFFRNSENLRAKNLIEKFEIETLLPQQLSSHIMVIW